MFLIAYNEQGRTVNAHDLCATPELRAWARKSRFECVECAERHPVHICFRDVEKAELSGRRSHGPAWWHHRGGGGGGSGAGATESETHWHAKHILSEHVGRYSFVTKRCKGCEQHTAVEAGADATGAVEREERLAGGRSYRFDAVLLQGARVRSVLEVWASHQTAPEKRAYCLRQGYTFGEFDAGEVVRQHEQAQGAPYRLQNLSIDYFECQACCEEQQRRLESTRLAEERRRVEVARLAQESMEQLRVQRIARLELQSESREFRLLRNAELDLLALKRIEAESLRYAEGRRALDVVIARKTQNSECFEEERLAHNKLLALELDADRRRMKVLMLMRRMGVTETKYH